MFGRDRVASNRDVATLMRQFFGDLTPRQRAEPESVAESYGRFVYRGITNDGVIRQAIHTEATNPSRRRYYVGISVDQPGYADLTKRAMTIAETLVLSSAKDAPYWELRGADVLTPELARRKAEYENERRLNTAAPESEPGLTVWASRPADPPRARRRDYQQKWPESRRIQWLPQSTGMRCLDLKALGKWLLHAEPLLRAGLAWYLPTYSGPPWLRNQDEERKVIAEYWGSRGNPYAFLEFIARDGRIIDMSGVDPGKSRLVRSVARIDLPFIDGVDLADFSRITIEEFGSYSQFRNYMRMTLHKDVPEAMGDTLSEQSLHKVEAEIAYQAGKVKTDMAKLATKRWWTLSTAALGTVSATLVAVYGPILQQAIGVIGVSGGLWGLIHSLVENSPRQQADGEWHYVWVLSRHAHH